MARKEFSGVCALFFLTNGAFGDKIVQNRTIGEDAMLPADFLDDVALLRRLYTRRFAELLRETGLNQAEMDVLLFLANNPPYDTARDSTAADTWDLARPRRRTISRAVS